MHWSLVSVVYKCIYLYGYTDRSAYCNEAKRHKSDKERPRERIRGLSDSGAEA